MTPFASVALGSALALWGGSEPVALYSHDLSAMTRPLILHCEGGPQDPFCAALGAALQAPPFARDVTFAGQEASRSFRDQDHLRFVQEQRGPDQISGHLSWRTRDASEARGPLLELTVMDAQLTPEMLRSFAQQLLRYSAFPS